MKHIAKKIICAVACIVVLLCITFFFANVQDVGNIINGYKEEVVKSAEISFYNWNDRGDGVLVSLEDPQICIKDVDMFVNNLVIDLELVDVDDTNQIIIYYMEDSDIEYTAEKSLVFQVDKQQSQIEVQLNKQVTDLRVDLTEAKGATLALNRITFNMIDWGIGIRDIALLMLMMVGCMMLYAFRNTFRELFYERELLVTLVQNDLKARYAGSFLGLVWAFAQPILTILVFWVVFELGFRQAPVENVTFILWFAPAYISWIYFQDAVVNASSSLREYSYLVKKMKFPVHMLPVMKVFSSIVIHAFFILLVIAIFVVYRFELTINILQVFYYLFALTMLLIGLSWLTSAITVFMKDFSQIISIILQIGFFAIPVFWNEATMDPNIVAILRLNPAFYIVEGYRDAFLGGELFWNKPEMTIYYWCVTMIVFIVGIKLFAKSRRHFADLL